MTASRPISLSPDYRCFRVSTPAPRLTSGDAALTPTAISLCRREASRATATIVGARGARALTYHAFHLRPSDFSHAAPLILSGELSASQRPFRRAAYGLARFRRCRRADCLTTLQLYCAMATSSTPAFRLFLATSHRQPRAAPPHLPSYWLTARRLSVKKAISRFNKTMSR